MRSRRQAHMKNQQIQRQQRRAKRVREIAHAHSSDIEDAGRDSGAGNGRAQIRLQHNQPQKHQHRRGRGQQRVAPVIDGLGAALQEVGEKQNQHRLGQFRRLERKSTGVNPAMRVVRAVEKEDGNQQQRGHAHHRKHQRGMLVAAVVHAHGDHHGGKSGHGPDQLLRQKRVLRAEALARHHRRRRKHHHQPDKHQQHGDGKQPAVDTHALCHGKFISPREREVREKQLLIVEF